MSAYFSSVKQYDFGSFAVFEDVFTDLQNNMLRDSTKE